MIGLHGPPLSLFLSLLCNFINLTPLSLTVSLSFSKWHSDPFCPLRLFCLPALLYNHQSVPVCLSNFRNVPHSPSLLSRSLPLSGVIYTYTVTP